MTIDSNSLQYITHFNLICQLLSEAHSAMYANVFL